jgi:hypothetical protein
MSERPHTDTEGLVKRLEQAFEQSRCDLPPEKAAWLRNEILDRFRRRLEQRTPQEEFADFAQRLKNRQGTTKVNFDLLLKLKAEFDGRLSRP